MMGVGLGPQSSTLGIQWHKGLYRERKEEQRTGLENDDMSSRECMHVPPDSISILNHSGIIPEVISRAHFFSAS